MEALNPSEYSSLGGYNTNIDYKALRKCIDGYNPETPEAKKPFQMEIISATELMNKEFKPPVWAVDGLLTTGLAILAGKPKAGKSWMALDLALSVATGRPFLKRHVTKGKVLYAALEDNFRRLQERLKKLLDEGEKLDNLLLVTQLPKLNEGGFEALRKTMDQDPELQLIIIDTLQRIKPLSRANKGQYEQDYEALIPLQSIAIDKDVSIMVITHLRKLTASDKFDQISGTLGLNGVADLLWILDRERHLGEGSLSVTGRDVEEKEIAVEFDMQTCRWNSHGNAGLHFSSEERRKIHEYLKSQDSPQKPKQIAQAVGRSEGSVKHILLGMLSQGLVIRPSRGMYQAFIPDEDVCY